MWGMAFRLWLCAAVGLLTTGCGGNSAWRSQEAFRPEAASAPGNRSAQMPQNARYLSVEQARVVDVSPAAQFVQRSAQPAPVQQAQRPIIQVANHQQVSEQKPEPQTATLTIDGRTFQIQLIEEYAAAQTATVATNPADSLPAPALLEFPAENTTSLPQPVPSVPADVVQLNLPTALSLVDGQHPLVGFAQWRVQEAYAQLKQAQVLWLPTIQPGFSFHKHDGNYQASDGSIVDVNRNSFQYGLGTGATGAGTTQQPGIVAQFHLADAIFQPKIAERRTWARGHAANGVVNQQLLHVALGYLELLDAEQEVRIVEETQQRTQDLAKLTADFAATGQGLQADADRLQTELRLVESRLQEARERADVASARLAQALSIDVGKRILPLDPTVVPLELVSREMDKGTLIGTGLSNRPELKEAQALVAAAWEEYQRQKCAPFVPSVLLGFSPSGFGGGLGNRLANTQDRYDLDGIVTWRIRNLGFGEAAARRESEAQIQQAKFEKMRLLDQVAREIAEAHVQVLRRDERIRITEQAIQSADDSYQRNLRRIRDGQGLPLEVLQSIRALEDARRAYLGSIIDYNEAQFRLQWALGWPVFEPPQPASSPAKHG